MSYAQTVTVYSVEERLPAWGEDARGWCTIDGEWLNVRRVNGGWLCDSGGSIDQEYVTHWHELPGPPGVECEPCYGTGEAGFQDEGGASWSETCARCKGTGRDNTGRTPTGEQP